VFQHTVFESQRVGERLHGTIAQLSQ